MTGRSPSCTTTWSRSRTTTSCSTRPENFNGTVIVQADKNIDFKVIKKVMYSCAVAGYKNVNFAVQQKAKGGG